MSAQASAAAVDSGEEIVTARKVARPKVGYAKVALIKHLG
jgi:hypothetical protein